MTDTQRSQREVAIHAAAYDLLARHGYGGTSMLRVAQAAKASNETLYRWYGDKDGLFTAMVRANAGESRALILTSLEENADPWAALAERCQRTIAQLRWLTTLPHPLPDGAAPG